MGSKSRRRRAGTGGRPPAPPPDATAAFLQTIASLLPQTAPPVVDSAAYDRGRTSMLADLVEHLPRAIVGLTQARVTSGEVATWTRTERDRIVSFGLDPDEHDTALVLATTAALAAQIALILKGAGAALTLTAARRSDPAVGEPVNAAESGA